MMRAAGLTLLLLACCGLPGVVSATPLSMNEYKVQLTRTAVKRAILKAAGQWEGA